MIVDSNSEVEDEAGRGIHSVGGSARPGKVSKRTLTTGCMMEALVKDRGKRVALRFGLFPMARNRNSDQDRCSGRSEILSSRNAMTPRRNLVETWADGVVTTRMVAHVTHRASNLSIRITTALTTLGEAPAAKRKRTGASSSLCAAGGEHHFFLTRTRG